MLFEISLENLAGLYKMTALGKLINGLIHNLNGPLQNLGMDIEMMQHAVLSDKRLPADLGKNMGIRLHRMEAEFDHISGLIRSTSMRTSFEDDYLEYANLRDFLEQEISFLDANLYFKHNVHKEIRMEEGLPPLRTVPEIVALSLIWFIQSLVEELEREKAKRLAVEVRPVPHGMEISLITDGENLPGKWVEGLALDTSPGQVSRMEDEDVGLILSVALLKSNGVSFTAHSQPSQSKITLTMHLPGNP